MCTRAWPNAGPHTLSLLLRKPRNWTWFGENLNSPDLHNSSIYTNHVCKSLQPPLHTEGWWAFYLEQSFYPEHILMKAVLIYPEHILMKAVLIYPEHILMKAVLIRVLWNNTLTCSHAATEPPRAPTLGAELTLRRLAISWVAAPTMLLDATIVFTKDNLQSSLTATEPPRAPTLGAELTLRRLAMSWVASPTMLLDATIVFTKDNLQSSLTATEPPRAPTLMTELTLRRLAMSWVASPTMLLDTTIVFTKESWEKYPKIPKAAQCCLTFSWNSIE